MLAQDPEERRLEPLLVCDACELGRDLLHRCRCSGLRLHLLRLLLLRLHLLRLHLLQKLLEWALHLLGRLLGSLGG